MNGPAARRRGVLADRRISPVGVALGLALGPAVALGLGRFAYALILPSMRSDLNWNFATAGLLNTANAAGYLIGALATPAAARRWGHRRVFTAMMALAAVSLLGVALAWNVLVFLALRLGTGVAGAMCFIVGAGLVAEIAERETATRTVLLFGVYFAGGGLGIIVSGALVPPVLEAAGWRGGWVVLAGLAGLAVLAALPAARSAPAPSPSTGPRPLSSRPLTRILRSLLISYFLFGAGYIAYMTFIVAFLQAGGSGSIVTWFWMVLGLAAVLASFAWPPLLGRLRGGWSAAITISIVAVGALLPLLSTTPVAATASAVLFGGAFLSVVAAMTTASKAALPRPEWTAGISTLTVAFASGQCIGPALAGMLSDSGSGPRLGLQLSVLVLALASVTALAHRQARPER